MGFMVFFTLRLVAGERDDNYEKLWNNTIGLGERNGGWQGLKSRQVIRVFM